MNISKEELKEVKLKLFNDYISKEEKDNIDNEINDEINEIIKEFNIESEPIDE